MKIPLSPDSVLARLEGQNDLGKTKWYEVVYHDGESWQSYQGSETFDTVGDVVTLWAYCDDVFRTIVPLKIHST